MSNENEESTNIESNGKGAIIRDENEKHKESNK